MPVEENLRTMRNLLEAWNSHDVEQIRPFFHESFENHQMPFPPVIGLEAYLAHCKHWYEAFPDFTLEAKTLFGQNEFVCMEARGVGTRSGSFFGNEASGREEVNDATDIFEFEDGKILRERGYWDFSVVTGRPAPMAGGHENPASPFYFSGGR
jgi:predicted ester cyclase